MIRRCLLAVSGLAGLAGVPGCGGPGASGLLVVASVSVTPPGSDLVAGTSVQFSATARTSSGVAIPNRHVEWSSSNPNIASVSPSGLVTALVVGGPVTLSATVDGVTGTAIINVIPEPVDRVTVDPPQADILVGESTVLVATPLSASGAPLSRPVVWSSTNSGIASVTVSGTVVGMGAGVATVRATVDGKVGTSEITVRPRPATRLSFVTQPPNGVAGQPLSPAVRVAVQDDVGNTIGSATTPISLTLSTNPTGTVLQGTTTVNAVAGVATFDNLVLQSAGSGYGLRAAALALSPAVSSPFAITSAGGSRLVLVTAPAAAGTSGVPLSPQPVVQIEDAFGNPVAGAGVAVTAQLASGPGGTLSGTTTITTDPAGRAAFTTLTITGPQGTYTLRFGSPGLTEVTSGPIGLGAGAPTQLAIVTQPSAAAQSGVPFPQQPVIRLADQGGNGVSGVAVTASIATGGGTLGGTTTVTTDGSGSATFTDLNISGAPGDHTLQFDAAGLSGISDPITVSPGPASQLTITTQPSSSVQAGTVFPQQPVIQLRDGAGNPVSEAGVNVSASIASGGGALSGTTTVATDASGVATYTDLAITGTTGDHTLSFDAAGLTGVVSSTITVTAGPVATLVIITQPSAAAQSGVVFAQQPVVRAQDAGGTNLSGVTVTASLTGGGGGAVLQGTLSRVTASNGRATFTDLAISGPVGNYTLTFTSGAASTVSNTIVLSVGPEKQLTITTQPSSMAVTGLPFPQQPVIQLRDSGGNPVLKAGVSVTAVLASGPGTLGGGVTVTTDANGTATFTDLRIDGTGDHTIRFESAGLTSVTSITITVAP